LVLVALSVVEQRLRAVMAVLDGSRSGRPQAGHRITVHVSHEVLVVELDDQEIRTITRTTTRPAWRRKAHRPHGSARAAGPSTGCRLPGLTPPEVSPRRPPPGQDGVTRLRGVSARVTLEPWGSGDLPLLERLMGDPRMTEHLGGPESPDKLRERQGRYERLDGGDRMFKIVDLASGAGVGSVGFWAKEWRAEQVYEVGWMVVPEFQGRGGAVAATAQAIELAKRDDKHRFMHAFPNVYNAPSNAICRKLGFELLEACEFEFPKGPLHELERLAPGPARLVRPPRSEIRASEDGLISALRARRSRRR
jgi:RimJ/RimL family protein N-acetyltransferase